MPRGLPASYIKKAKRELGKGASWHDIFKRAWQLYKGSKVYKAVSGNPTRKKGSRKKSSRKRSVSRMAKKKRRYRRKMTIPLLPVAGIGAAIFAKPGGFNLSPFEAATRGNFEYALRALLRTFTGYDYVTGEWSIQAATGLWATLGGFVGHKIANALGINRLLATHKVPLIRI